MNDENKFGPVLHRLSFADAIKQELLTDYQVIVVGVTSDARLVAYATAPWEFGFGVLQKYVDAHGDARVPSALESGLSGSHCVGQDVGYGSRTTPSEPASRRASGSLT